MTVEEYVRLEEDIESAFYEVMDRLLPNRSEDLRRKAAQKAAKAVTMTLIYADHYRRQDGN